MATTNKRGKRWDFVLNYGDYWGPPDSFQLFDDDGEVIPLAGASVLMHIKKKAADPIPEKVLEDGDGFVIVDDEVRFDTNVDFGPDNYVHDIRVIINSKTYTPYHGTVSVKTRVTPAT